MSSEEGPVSPARSGRQDPREVARAYLKEHNIVGLFNELGSAIVYEKPDDIHDFLIRKLQTLQNLRKSGVQGSIFTDQDLETLFDMYDSEKTGKVAPDACVNAVCALGAQIDGRVESKNQTAPSAPLNKPEFIQFCKTRLLVAGRDPSA